MNTQNNSTNVCSSSLRIAASINVIWLVHSQSLWIKRVRFKFQQNNTNIVFLAVHHHTINTTQLIPLSIYVIDIIINDHLAIIHFLALATAWKNLPEAWEDYLFLNKSYEHLAQRKYAVENWENKTVNEGTLEGIVSRTFWRFFLKVVSIDSCIFQVNILLSNSAANGGHSSYEIHFLKNKLTNVNLVRFITNQIKVTRKHAEYLVFLSKKYLHVSRMFYSTLNLFPLF